MATSFPFAQQFSLQHTAPNLSEQSTDDPNIIDGITIVGNVHSATFEYQQRPENYRRCVELRKC